MGGGDVVIIAHHQGFVWLKGWPTYLWLDAVVLAMAVSRYWLFLRRLKKTSTVTTDRSDPFWLRKELKRVHADGFEVWNAMNFQISCATVGFPNHKGHDDECVKNGRQWLDGMHLFMDENLPLPQREEFSNSSYSAEMFKASIEDEIPSNPTLLAVRGEVGFELLKIEALISQF